MAWLETFTLAAGIVWLYMTTLWLVSLWRKDASIVDIFWGLGFVILIAFYSRQAGNGTPHALLSAALVGVWGLRLSAHIGWRNWGRPEDHRYRAWREQAGVGWWWWSYCKVFLLQGLVMWLISAPLLTTQQHAEVTLLDGIGVAVWGVGLYFEAVGDWQLLRFKANPANKERVMRTGLWAYTRHPNYFGEALMWWGFFGMALHTPADLILIYSPLLMTFLLRRVSGVTMLEETLALRPGYQAYREQVPAFWPRWKG